MKFEVFKGKNSEHYFRLTDKTGKILLTSEGYKQKESALSGIESVKKNMPLPTAIEMKATDSGKHYFNVKSTNGQTVGTSTMFDSPDLRDNWIKELSEKIASSEVIELKN